MIPVPGLESPITAAAYDDRYGVPAVVVISRIRKGTLKGAKHNGVWYAEDAPPPADRTVHTVAPPRTPAREPLSAATPNVVRYTSQRYVHVLMGVLAVLIASDLVSFLFSQEFQDLRGVGTRVFVLFALRTQHKWARIAVQVWSGGLIVAGVAGLSLVLTADPEEFVVAWWGTLLFAASLVIGLFYLATAHRYIKVGRPVDEESPATLEALGREARLD